MKKTQRSHNSTLRLVSQKRQDKNPEYFELVNKLRELCRNRSEMTGKSPNWESDYLVEPHHIGKRDGDRLANPFEIVMLTREEHDTEGGKRKGVKFGKERLYREVEALRISQGFIKNSSKTH